MAKQWRVSWEMWPHEWPIPHRTEKVYDDEAQARDHFNGLVSIKADHLLRPCSDHVWDVLLEEREVQETWSPTR